MDTTNRRYVFAELQLSSDLLFQLNLQRSNGTMLTATRPQLPALSYLDIDKTKREEEAYQHRHSGASHAHHSAPIASPTYSYPAHPPPPYSHPAPQHANSWPGVKTTVHTPPDSRRTSGEDSDHIIKTSRQSLPSISEALGETSYPSSTSAAQPPAQPTAPASPPPSARRTYGMDPPQPINPFANSSTYPYSSFRQDSAGPQSYPPPDSTKPAYAPLPEPRPPLQLQTSQPPRSQQPTNNPFIQATSPQYEQPQSSQSSGTMGAPSFPYGYTPYPPRYAQPTSTSSHSGPIYQPSTQYPAPSTPSSTWKSETNTSRFGKHDRVNATTYSESVKRQLDIFDLEGALSEVSSN